MSIKGYGNDVKGIPFIVTAKVFYSYKIMEFFFGGGAGFYHAQFHGRFHDVVITASDTVFGEHVQAGVNINISPVFFIGVEDKYIFTKEADFDILKSRMNGHTATINFGYRF